MEGMFKANGRCGYVKKPDFLLDKDHIFNPAKPLPVKTNLKVCSPIVQNGFFYICTNKHLSLKKVMPVVGKNR